MSRAATIIAFAGSFALTLGGYGIWRSVGDAPARRGEADALVREFEAVQLPRGFFLNDEQHAQLEAGMRKQCELARQMVERFPRDARTPALARTRWQWLSNGFGEHDQVVAETQTILVGSISSGLRQEAVWARAWAAVHTHTVRAEDCRRMVDEAIASGIDAESALWLLYEYGRRHDVTPALLRERSRELSSRYASEPECASLVAEFDSALALIGKTLDVELSDPARGAAFELEGRFELGCVVLAAGLSDPALTNEIETLESLQVRLGDAKIGLAAIFEAADMQAVRSLNDLDVDWPRAIEILDEATYERTWRYRHGLDTPRLLLVLDANGVIRGVTFHAASVERVIEAVLDI